MGKKIRGRKVREEESPYSQPEIEKLREKYKEAVPLLQFTTTKAVSSEDDIRIKVAIDNLRQSGHFSEDILGQLEAEWVGKEPAIAIPNITLEAEAIQRIAYREGIDLFQECVMISKDSINREIEQIKRERSTKISRNGGMRRWQKLPKASNRTGTGNFATSRLARCRVFAERKNCCFKRLSGFPVFPYFHQCLHCSWL